MDGLHLRIALGSFRELYALPFQAMHWVRVTHGIKGMDRAEFQDWLAAANRRTSAQRAKAADALSIDANEKRSAEGSGTAVYISLEDLEASVLDFVARRNENEAKPLKWTDSPGRLIAARQLGFQMTRTNH